MTLKNNSPQIAAVKITGAPDLQYVLVRSNRRTLSMIIQSDGALEIRCPLNYSRKNIDHFILSKIDWIIKKRQENRITLPIPALSKEEQLQAIPRMKNLFESLSLAAADLIHSRLTIRDQKSRWGSCSSKGRISLNIRCSQLPEALIEYVVLHELCHLAHLNHSASFWKLLESYLPDYKTRRQKLNHYRLV